MGSYGFRLFSVTLHHGRKHKCVKFSECGNEHYSAAARRYIESLAAVTRVGEPADLMKELEDDTKSDVLASSTDQKPGVRFDKPALYGNVLRGTLYAGRFGAHDAALSAENTDAIEDIKKMAASRTFRYILALPDDDSLGILAVEDISRSCPVSVISKWLKYQSQFESVETSGSEPEKTASPSLWWRLRVNALTDHDRLRRLIRQGKMERIEIVKKAVTPERTRKEDKYRISAPVLGVEKARDASFLAKSWLRQSESRDETSTSPVEEMVTDRLAARQLAAIIGPEIAELDLDDGWLVVEGETEATKISPSRISEIFTYPQSKDKSQIGDDAFYQLVKSTALQVRKSGRFNIDWPR